MASIKKNFLYQATYQLLLILTPLITTPFLSRVLGASQVGVYSYTYSITNYFVMFIILGMSSYGVREIAACGKDRKKRTEAFWGMFSCQLFASVIVVAVYVVYMLNDPQGGFVLACVWGMWVISAVLDVTWLFFGVEEFKIPTIRSIITKIASLVIIFVFIRTPDDLWIYCAAIAGSYLVNQILLWPFLRRYVDVARPSFVGVRKHLGPNLRLFIPVIAISFYVTLDKVMLGAMTDMTQTGFFEYSEKLSRMPMAVITAMGTVMLPRMTAELHAGNRTKALGLLQGSIGAMLAMAFALMFGIIAIAPEFASVFLGDQFASCWSLMSVLAIIIPVVSVTNVLGRQYLLPTDRDKLFTWSVCIGAVVNICCNIALIPHLAAMGAAISTVCAELAVLVAQVIMTHKELPLLRYLKNAVPFILCGVVMFFAVRFSANIFDLWWGLSVQGLVLEIVVGVVVFGVLSGVWGAVTKNHFMMELAEGMKARLRK